MIRKKNARKKKSGEKLQKYRKRMMLACAAGILLTAVWLGGKRQETQLRETGYITAGINEKLLMLVNKTHKIPEGYEPELHWLKNGSCAVENLMYDALSEMLTDGSREGLQFVVASGYRSKERQEELLEEDIAADMQNLGMSYEEAYEKETRETMPPGCSEHETGLAVDLVSLDYQILDQNQEFTAENQWLREHCSEYGFILRYPKGKEDITEVDYESWHFRYVGREAAKIMTEQGLTLEEYVEG